MSDKDKFLLYTANNGAVKVEVLYKEETVWLTQKRMAELFRKNVRTINEHIQNIFAEGELVPESVVRKFRITADDGKIYDTQHYNLDVIISVGYRVKSHRGTQFRIWATERLREFIIKGFALDDDRLKQAGGGNYFEELLARIRDIRSSEKVFWRKVLDIYATSIDYDPRAEASQLFFATVQNKMHWAAHGKTAAEIVYQRARTGKRKHGSHQLDWQHNQQKRNRHCQELPELRSLTCSTELSWHIWNLLKSRRWNEKPMYMSDWITKLDDFLKLSGRELLTHAGKISHEQAFTRTQLEHEKYRAILINQPSAVEVHFDETVRKMLKPGPKRDGEV
jgi:hypothetical protein